MEIRMDETTAVEFFSTITTSTLIEQRIQLMLQDPNVISITFKNGRLSFGKLDGSFVYLEEWQLSFEETIQVMTNVCEQFEMIANKPTIWDGNVWFQDVYLQFTNLEEEGLDTLEERFIHSDFTIHMAKIEHMGRNTPVTEDDLPF